MPLELSQFEKIEAYFTGGMTPEERRSFEQEAAKDSELKKALEDYSVIYGGIREKQYQKILSEVQAFEAGLPPISELRKERRTAKVRKLAWRVSAAASILLISYFSLHLIAVKRFEQTALRLFEPDTIQSNISMGPSEPSPDLEKLYIEKRYQEIISILKSTPPDAFNYLYHQYGLGLCYFELGKYKEAIPYWDYVADHMYINGTNTLVEINDKQFQWDRLMALTAAGEFNEKFQSALASILSDPDHPYRDKALKIKAQTEGFWQWFR